VGGTVWGSAPPFVRETPHPWLLRQAFVGIVAMVALPLSEERRQAEAGLAFAASIVESSDDAIVGMTLYGIITSCNAGAERRYGYTAREVFGRWPIGITIPEDELLDRVSPSDRSRFSGTPIATSSLPREPSPGLRGKEYPPWSDITRASSGS
jgi:PAS domain-containing protein